MPRTVSVSENVTIGQSYRGADITYKVSVESHLNSRGVIECRDIVEIEVVESPFSEARSLAVFDTEDFWDFFKNM